MQVKYPNQYNGIIACAPDPVDFRALSPLNIYRARNAFRRGSTGLQLQQSVTGTARTYTGDVLSGLEQDWRLEVALGGAVSGGQLGAWMAVYGPKDDLTGLPRALWDRETGEIDAAVAAHWRENYDISHIVKRDWNDPERNLSRALHGKLHVFVGSMDAYYLDAAVYLMVLQRLLLLLPMRRSS